jgi:para-nitrobenzyl esterase
MTTSQVLLRSDDRRDFGYPRRTDSAAISWRDIRPSLTGPRQPSLDAYRPNGRVNTLFKRSQRDKTLQATRSAVPRSGSFKNFARQRRRLSALLLLFIVPFHSALAESDNPPSLVLGTLTVTGETLNEPGIEVFRGIPFAAPPIGPLRWMPPQPRPTNPQQLTATRFAPACYQGEHITNWYQDVVQDFGGDPSVVKPPKVSEDCLYLNLWRPKDETAPLPIVVFIHGGSNRGGFSYEPNYLGHRLAAQGVIVITIAYRVGAFGFFAHPALAGSNFGLLDQIQALKFIQQHSQALGGDPNRITIMGESAGANSINFLIASPLAQGLFQRAIHQSGGSAVDRETDPSPARKLGARLTQQLTGLRGEAALAAARQLPSSEVLAAAESIYDGFYFDPVVDGTSVVMPPRQSLDTGALAPIDLLIGTNRDEWLMYLDPEQKLDDWLAEHLSDAQRSAVLPLLSQFSSASRVLDVLITAQAYVCPSLRLASHLSSINKAVYVYEFNKVRPGKMAAAMGAYHGAELPYIFDTHDEWLPTDDSDRALTALMQRYWTNFIKTGNPNAKTVVSWPAYEDQGEQVLRLDTASDVGPHTSAAICRALVGVGAAITASHSQKIGS